MTLYLYIFYFYFYKNELENGSNCKSSFYVEFYNAFNAKFILNLYVPVLFLVINEIQTIKEMLINPLWYDKV